MSVYAAITGGILTFVFRTHNIMWQPLAFLVFLTSVGFLINYRWRKTFEHNQGLIKRAASDLGLDAEVDVECKWGLIRTRNLFPLFYIGVLVLLLYL